MPIGGSIGWRLTASSHILPGFGTSGNRLKMLSVRRLRCSVTWINWKPKFVARNAQGQLVNRNPGMGMVGGCTDTNEFNFLQWKALTSWGVPYRDSQARV